MKDYRIKTILTREFIETILTWNNLGLAILFVVVCAFLWDISPTFDERMYMQSMYTGYP